MAESYNIIAEQEHCTVVAKYEPTIRNGNAYQSETELENWLISQLQRQGYEHPIIHNEEELMENLRLQLALANDTTFSDNEWKRLVQLIANDALTMEDKASMIQADNTAISLERDNGTATNVHLLHKDNIHKNRLQVINQYVPEGGTHSNRYDVTILVNGLPLVHIELKRRGVSIREAFNQINRYARQTFWAGKGMFDYIQLFVISNGTETKYYSNSTRYAREQEADKEKGNGKKKIKSNSFEFTSYWSDAENTIIYDLEDFAQTFLTQHTLLSILTRYCVLNVDKELLVMRPYQIAATERILLRIDQILSAPKKDRKNTGGYIWHTTGSGKTLTSFKTAQLASKMDNIYKVVFIVDRQDLDYQTMKEYDRFCPNCANGNANSSILLKQLSPQDQSRIIITTIQKMSSLLKRKKIEQEVLLKNFVFIFDECHRSQFGKMQKQIKQSFKNYIMFGFTGTPIFNKNAPQGELMTTAQVFGGELDDKGNHTLPLHTYTIIDAIRDKNVLKFKVEYHAQMAEKDGKKVENTQYLDPKRIETNVRYLLSHYDIKTKRSSQWKVSKLTNVAEVVKNFKRKKEDQVEEERQKAITTGFNSILACDSVPMAIAYYKELERQMAKPGAEQLRIATIFTTPANEAEEDLMGNIEEDPEGITGLDATSKDFLEECIKKYNKVFGTSYDTSAEKFQSYYKDLSLRTKNKDIDLLIVVGMFLTGFDAKCLNTLWVDKNLRMHGLLQAYSRTNRILNTYKNCGNIVCFRNLEEATNESFGLFGDKNANSIILIHTFEDYYLNGYDEKDKGKVKHYASYKELAEALLQAYPLGELNPSIAEEKKIGFIKLYGQFIKTTNILLSFDEFTPIKTEEQTEEEHLDQLNAIRIVKEGERQDYQSWYLNFRDELKGGYNGGQGGGTGGNSADGTEGTEASDGLEYEMELLNQVDIDIPYILALVKKYHDSNCAEAEVLQNIIRSVTSSPRLRDKRDLIESYIQQLKPGDDIDVGEEWASFIMQEREKELAAIISDENLKEEKAREFINKSFKDGYVEESGMAITTVLPPMPIFGAGNKRELKKKTVIEKFKRFVDRFKDLLDFNKE